CDLMLIFPVRNSRTPTTSHRIDIVIVAPGIGIQGAIADAPDRRTIELVGSRAGRDLDLPITPAQFGINRGQDESHLSDHVRVEDGRAEHAILETPVADAQTIANGVDRTR